MTASVDAAATGQNFVAATVPQNGDLVGLESLSDVLELMKMM